MIQAAAILLMLVDHIGYMLDSPVMRLIGRACMPLIVYLFAIGIRHTSNPMRYSGRLFLCGLVAQFPRYLLFGYFFPLNFVLLLSVISGIVAVNGSKTYLLFASLLGLAIFDFHFHIFGYSALYVLGIFAVFSSNLSRPAGVYFFCFVTLVASFFDSTLIYHILALPFLLLPPGRIHLLPDRFFYYFYPLHFLPLRIIF